MKRKLKHCTKLTKTSFKCYNIHDSYEVCDNEEQLISYSMLVPKIICTSHQSFQRSVYLSPLISISFRKYLCGKEMLPVYNAL
jgi:hypothetical protein